MSLACLTACSDDSSGSSGSDGTGTNGSFGGINYFAFGGSSAATEDAEYYIDDVMLVDVTGVGIEDNNNAFNFNVYPNPVVNTLFLNASNVKAGNYNLEIFDFSMAEREKNSDP